MESERFDAAGGNLQQSSLKPDTTLQLDIDDCNNSNQNNLDDTPPAMIIVETCINSITDSHVVSTTKQTERDICSTMEQPADQASCSITLGLKPNVQFNLLPQNVAVSSAEQLLLSSTEAALAAANISCATDIFDCHLDPPIAKLRRCVDGATQCNNLNLNLNLSLNVECEASQSSDSMPSIGSLVCRICHNADNPEQLVSPCLCKGSLTYVHVHCLERWISTSRCTICELCQFHYNTEQTLRYTCLQSLRLWYSRAMSRRALQEDCQMFSLLTLVAFGIIGTLLVGIQYYALHTQSWGLSKLWTKSWMLFFLLMTITVYFANVYMLIKSQLTPWYRWWQSARDIKLILENRRPFPNPNRVQPQILDTTSTTASMFTHHDQLEVPRRSPQPTYVTPSSSATSLPRDVAQPELATSQKLNVSKSTELGIQLALLGNNSNSNPKSNDCNDGNVEEQKREEKDSGN
ncbi:uncharacterized protein LOC117784705 [Drosophila innubila]|uniref:uncharacterized protein LOC117784705 n=1 Tax=Drosophila innubila TaxID=198719 RepID=UPI00148E3531|nr:uncharacterized protein LOC117784705 [Drosophila innubila]